MIAVSEHGSGREDPQPVSVEFLAEGVEQWVESVAAVQCEKGLEGVLDVLQLGVHQFDKRVPLVIVEFGRAFAQRFQ